MNCKQCYWNESCEVKPVGFDGCFQKQPTSWFIAQIGAFEETIKQLTKENERFRKRVNDTLEELAFTETVLDMVRGTKKELEANKIVCNASIVKKFDEIQKIGEKYSKTEEYYDELIEGRFVEMSAIAKGLVNQIGNEILETLNIVQ